VRNIAQQLVADGKGILAVDDFTPGITRRFSALNIPCTDETRRDYREMLFTASTAMKHVSGVILYDETFRQSARDGSPIPKLIQNAGALVGIKLDAGQKPLAFSAGEQITKGLDDLEERIAFYKSRGAKFAKWRAVISISETLPSHNCIVSNTHALARYAAICQTNGIVPIVEPDVLMTGDHGIERCEEVTREVLTEQFQQLALAGVDLEAMILKPNMITAGASCVRQASAEEVAGRTLLVLNDCVPQQVPGIAFLSGGQSEVQATEHLHLMNVEKQWPWKITFSYNRALQDSALKIWRGQDENIAAAQKAFAHRAEMNSLAALGQWSPDLENSV
jgi:fructose-bisphosphate aldolase, class I